MDMDMDTDMDTDMDVHVGMVLKRHVHLSYKDVL